jgi:glutaredoxin
MVTIYSFPECPYCKELKEIYDTQGIKYRDVNISLEENSEEWNTIAEASKAEEVPVIKIDRQLLVPNVSFQSINEAVEITKKFLA